MRGFRGLIALLLVATATAAPGPGPASAAFFGLFGSEEPPPPSAEALSFSFEIAGADGDLKRALERVSTVRSLVPRPPSDGTALAGLLVADWNRLLDAAWGLGFYDARVVIEAGGRVVVDGTGRPIDGAAALLDAYRGRVVVPVMIRVEPGPEFRLRDVRFIDAGTGAPFDPALLPPHMIGLKAGTPARSAEVLAAETRVLDHFRDLSRPLARVADRKPVVVHGAAAMDLAVFVDPGIPARIGPVTVQGAPGVDPRVVRSFIYTEPGDPYSRRAISDLRRSVARVEALGSVRVKEAERLDTEGRLPLEVEIAERAKRALSVEARYSTTEGPGVRGGFTHRNLFGGAERLRLDADLFWVGDTAGRRIRRFKDVEAGDFGSRFSASFLKPALGGTRNDFLADAVAERDRTEGYTSRRVLVTTGLRHRWSDTVSALVGLEFDRGQTSDPTGHIDYTLVGIPVSATYDSTDSLHDPKEGIRATAGVTPFPRFLGSTVGMTSMRGRVSAYRAIDREGRIVLAGIVGAGTVLGADAEDIPANRRFYAGGAGSVRGYAWRSLSPLSLDGRPVGGRSVIEGSLEARIRVTPTIGVVPFVDVGTAYAGPWPSFGDKPAIGAGVGLRYETGFGPVRLDVAFPLDRSRADRPVALYLGFGQAF